MSPEGEMAAASSSAMAAGAFLSALDIVKQGTERSDPSRAEGSTVNCRSAAPMADSASDTFAPTCSSISLMNDIVIRLNWACI